MRSAWPLCAAPVEVELDAGCELGDVGGAEVSRGAAVEACVERPPAAFEAQPVSTMAAASAAMLSRINRRGSGIGTADPSWLDTSDRVDRRRPEPLDRGRELGPAVKRTELERRRSDPPFHRIATTVDLDDEGRHACMLVAHAQIVGRGFGGQQ